MHLLKPADIRRLLPLRNAVSHKGNFGHVLVVAGSDTMPGAAVLSALGALRAGAGLVTVAASPVVQHVIHAHLPEAMTISREAMVAYSSKRKISTLVIGPGLGRGSRQKNWIRALLKLRLPTVLDADGLNNLTLKTLPQDASHLIITPHEGELAHLRGETRDAIHAERAEKAQATARQFGGVCVLKGHRTVIADARTLYVNPTGNPAMATGGMGDVLTGVIAGLLAQKLLPLAAATAGVYLHGLAGDLAAVSDRGLLARDVAHAIPQSLARLRRPS
jgi:hydroxyethylthiazole kinase-like uncharacterized protein yjeF